MGKDQVFSVVLLQLRRRPSQTRISRSAMVRADKPRAMHQRAWPPLVVPGKWSRQYFCGSPQQVLLLLFPLSSERSLFWQIVPQPLQQKQLRRPPRAQSVQPT
jgi:hypothetical protein